MYLDVVFEGITQDGRVIKFNNGVLSNKNLVEIKIIDQTYGSLLCRNNKLTSLPSVLSPNLYQLFCNGNKIEKLPDLKQCKKLNIVRCDLKNFEPYMLEMENVSFIFYC